MTLREQFLADCAELWDETDNRPCFIFGQPGTQVGLFAGAMTMHTIDGWVCFNFGLDADVKQMRRLIDRLSVTGDSRAH